MSIQNIARSSLTPLQEENIFNFFDLSLADDSFGIEGKRLSDFSEFTEITFKNGRLSFESNEVSLFAYFILI